MFNNEYYKVLLGEPVRYQDGKCIAHGWSEGAEGQCEDFDPVNTVYATWARARGRGWTDSVNSKWKTSLEEPGPFTFTNRYMVNTQCTKTDDCDCTNCNFESGIR